jgi:hypothetical protein
VLRRRLTRWTLLVLCVLPLLLTPRPARAQTWPISVSCATVLTLISEGYAQLTYWSYQGDYPVGGWPVMYFGIYAFGSTIYGYCA